MEIVHDGRLTASCRKPLADQAGRVGGPLGRQLSRPNRVREEYDKSAGARWAAAEHGLTVVWLRPGEFGKPGGSRLLIDKYVCSWTWLSLVGS